jgi:hypothetical protein
MSKTKSNEPKRKTATVVPSAELAKVIGPKEREYAVLVRDVWQHCQRTGSFYVEVDDALLALTGERRITAARLSDLIKMNMKNSGKR